MIGALLDVLWGGAPDPTPGGGPGGGCSTLDGVAEARPCWKPLPRGTEPDLSCPWPLLKGIPTGLSGPWPCPLLKGAGPRPDPGLGLSSMLLPLPLPIAGAG